MPLPRSLAQSLRSLKTTNKDLVKIEEDRKIAEAKALAEAEAKRLAEIPKIKIKAPKTQDEHDLFDLINWIYSIPYSRRLTFVPRDFSDGVLVSEIVKHFVPELVDLHNYRSANGRTNKTLNWELLNKKVFSQLGFKVGAPLIEQLIAPKRFNVHETIARCYPIEKLLVQLRFKLGRINPKVYDYRTERLPNRDPFKKKNTNHIFRPLTRQPMSSSMWRIEKQAAEKYGEYKGNPITWDNLKELEFEAELAQASVGKSKHQHKQIKEELQKKKLEILKNDKKESEEQTLSDIKTNRSREYNLPGDSTNVRDWISESDQFKETNAAILPSTFTNYKNLETYPSLCIEIQPCNNGGGGCSWQNSFVLDNNPNS